jgi:hypothetical protein
MNLIQKSLLAGILAAIAVFFLYDEFSKKIKGSSSFPLY